MLPLLYVAFLASAALADLPPYPQAAQGLPPCRPYPVGVEPSPQERLLEGRFFTFPERTPDYAACSPPGPCLIACPDRLQPFGALYEKNWRGFELLLVNPGPSELVLVLPTILPVIREALADGWRPIEREPCWPWCGNANDAVRLQPGYSYRFIVPVYAGSITTPQRFRFRFGSTLRDSRTIYSNTFDGTFSETQLVPVPSCPEPEVIEAPR